MARSTTSKMKQSAPMAMPPSERASKPASTAQRLAAASMLIAVASAGFSAWAAYEARALRLDGTRARLKAETIHGLAEMRLSVSMFNCYGAVKGVNLRGRSEIEALFKTMEPKIREGLSTMPSWGEGALEHYENTLIRDAGSFSVDLKDILLKVRATWTKEELERVDAACKVS